MDKRDKKIRQLENERNRLMTENQELKYIINDIQAVNDVMREDIEKECAAECGCIVIEGSRTSAAYQDLVGILLANNYSVIRAGVQKQFGQHHVSANMAGNFERIRKEQVK